MVVVVDDFDSGFVDFGCGDRWQWGCDCDFGCGCGFFFFFPMLCCVVVAKVEWRWWRRRRLWLMVKVIGAVYVFFIVGYIILL